jgi:uncharacterized membrane protein (DUF485 family)
MGGLLKKISPFFCYFGYRAMITNLIILLNTVPKEDHSVAVGIIVTIALFVVVLFLKHESKFTKEK